MLMGAHSANGLGGAHLTKVGEVTVHPRCGVLVGAHGCSFGQWAWECLFNQGGGHDHLARVWGACGCLWVFVWQRGLGVLVQPRWGI